MPLTPVYIICSPRPLVGKTLTARLLSEFLLLKHGAVAGFDINLKEPSLLEYLPEITETHTLEVSSPGSDRPLSKPDHFRRFLGRRARVRTREARDGHKSFTGELVGANDREVTIAATTGVVAIPYDDITRSNLVEE